MKKFFTLASLLLLIVSCSTELETIPESQPKTAGDFVFYASFGDQAAPETKVLMDENWKLGWNAGDRISVFNQTEDNLQFAFTGEDGATAGRFSSVDGNAVLDGSSVPYIYAVYPYSAGTNVAADGTISLTLPAEQTYYGGVSFGRGANTMVSVTDHVTDNLLFRNVCGYVQLKLYGEDVSVTGVTFRGNSGEHLAGAASVTARPGEAPSVTMGAGAVTEVSVVCSEPVTLGADEGHYTTFMLAIPPTTFEHGFTIAVTDSDGYVFEKSTAKNYTIDRNTVFPMAPVCCREIEEFEIENAGTRDFIRNVDYSGDPGYTISYVDQYRNTASDEPLPFKVSTGGAAKIRMKALTSPYSGAEWTVSGTSVYNLIPGVVYHYDVLNNAGAVLKSGFVRPVGQVRMINGFSYNVRDMGGWHADGGTIAYGKLYRGAQLEGITNNGKNIFLNDLGISIDLDLRRTKSDGSERPSDVLNLGVNGYENIPTLKFFDNGSGNTCDLYQMAIRDIINWLGEGKPVYFHCAGGADRTGSLSFLIEALLGVSESDLSKDYELTSFDDGRHTRRRNDPGPGNTTYILTYLVNYLRQDRFGGTAVSINQNVVNWAKTRFSDSMDPLTDDEIARLRNIMIIPE